MGISVMVLAGAGLLLLAGIFVAVVLLFTSHRDK